MDATAANIGLSRDALLANLAASRLLSEAEVEQFLAAHPGDDALSLASSLVSSGTLTNYQLDAIAQGLTGELRVGNYDILDRLGAGGMGTVFKARHRRMKRVVALKVLAAALCKDESFVRRFQREVEVIARLGHPNIVMAYDADEAEVGHFLVMEFVDGRDLTSFVAKNHPLGVAQAADGVVQAARGLAFAHAQGVVHRDIKPGNLLRDSSGVVKVTDLGLARLNSGESDASAARGLTQAGGVLGTVDYMAPEQAVDSTTVDHRADIYSLGATLHFLLTGRPPYTGNTVMSVLLKHRDAPIPSLRESRPDVPPELDEVFRRMLAKSPDDRYRSMNDVVAALEGVATRLGGSPATPGAVAAPAAPAWSVSSVVVETLKTQATVGAHAAPHAKLSVVIVEPSRVQAGIIRKYLESQNLTPAAAVGTGAAAAAAVREQRPDAVVSALHLPDTTGVELAQQIRAEIRDYVPGFVLISSEADGNQSGTLSRLDRVLVLPKPFTAEQIAEALRVVTAASPAASALSAARPRVERSALRVLLVDDSAVARTYERMVLEGLGFGRFTEAADGAQAIAAATREPFDLIVTDYNMPLMDGYALVSYLRQTAATAAIPIVMVTTETSAAVLDPVRKLGVAGVFDKTFPAAEVKRVIDELFG